MWHEQLALHQSFSIGKAPLTQIVREIIGNRVHSASSHVQASALAALMKAADANLTTLFSAANLATIHARHVTL
ncbi:hypothetical protein O1611_g2415 [Lasiodiplodia mahajangana]|uniref:Uncharacterized protein n=1 Tax=Lasiodiplodia mahajangana TaxID=1108764 RepID=A0ACC2JUL1_9PEZI|nr:hypothetical protein O1611_g2415 [Lasiodiplodia mahajangana]